MAVVGLRHSLTGDTLCDTRHPIVLEKLEFPEPVITMSIEPRTSADKQKLGDALAVLRREDPSFRYRHDGETGQTVISGMGELHLEIVRNKLVRDMGVDVHVGRPRVAYKETITAPAEAEGRFIRQTGGRGQYGVVVLRVEPFVPAAGERPIAFEDATRGGVIPQGVHPLGGAGRPRRRHQRPAGGLPDAEHQGRPAGRQAPPGGQLGHRLPAGRGDRLQRGGGARPARSSWSRSCACR